MTRSWVKQARPQERRKLSGFLVRQRARGINNRESKLILEAVKHDTQPRRHGYGWNMRKTTQVHAKKRFQS
jgi:hypothetical protein